MQCGGSHIFMKGSDVWGKQDVMDKLNKINNQSLKIKKHSKGIVIKLIWCTVYFKFKLI